VKKKLLKKRSKTDWKRINLLKDEDIDYSDIPELGKDFFTNAVIKMPEPKTTITIRLDRDVLDWFKKQGKKYQTRINAILRAYMELHLTHHHR
jgi:uncharacterized protein (DUF4415 family)